MTSKLLLIGEPMGLFLAETEGALETVREYATAVAGTEFHVALGLSRLGHTVGFMTKLGRDPFGKMVVDVMRRNRMDTSLVLYSEDHFTGFMLKAKDSGGDPPVFYYRKNSAAATLNMDEIGSINLNEYRYLYLTGIFPALSPSTLEATKALARRAKARGITLFFDPNLRPQLWSDEQMMAYHINELAFLSDYFLPSVKEGSLLTGGLSTPESIASYYQVRGIPNVIIKAGPAGAYLATKNDHEYMPAYEIGRATDRAGAGDGFSTGFVSGILEGLSIRGSVDRGNAIGAMRVMSSGSSEGPPDREGLAAFIQQHRTGRIPLRD